MKLKFCAIEIKVFENPNWSSELELNEMNSKTLHWPHHSQSILQANFTAIQLVHLAIFINIDGARPPSCFVSCFADVISTTPTQRCPDKHFTFQCASPHILSPCSISDTPFLLRQTSNLLSRPLTKTRNILLIHYPMAAFFPRKQNPEPRTEVPFDQSSDYPVPLIVSTRNLFLPKTSKILFGFIPHDQSVPYPEPF